MTIAALAIGVTLALFLAMLACAEVGRRLGVKRLSLDADGGLEKGASTSEGALFALLGLLIAFTFSAAASRLEHRKELIVQEANAVGTAWLRLDLLPVEARGRLRHLFLRYLDVRISTYADVTDLATTYAKLDEGAALQDQIWQQAILALKNTEAAPSASNLLVPALNEMIDITTTRLAAARNHAPIVVFVLLTVLSLLAALLVGYGTSLNAKRGWLHIVIFAAVVSVTIQVIIDLEFPRVGFIRVDDSDRVLIELQHALQNASPGNATR